MVNNSFSYAQPQPNLASAVKSSNHTVKIGFYEIESTIGKGNFALVKLAKHRITKTEVNSFFPF